MGFGVLERLKQDEEVLDPNFIQHKPISIEPMSSFNSCFSVKIDWPYRTIYDYHRAYLNKDQTPSKIVRKIFEITILYKFSSLDGIKEMKMEQVIQMADESTKRYEKNEQLSMIDGVPFFVKEHICMKGYQRGIGSEHHDDEAVKTAFCIKRLIKAGAIPMGTATMTLLGKNPLGYNTTRPYVYSRNPFNTDHYPGGSSSGSAIVVASGLCPFSIGSDGLGSIRIPSSFCGLVGLKPTFDLISARDSLMNPELNQSTVIGPLATCVSDCALIYDIISVYDKKYVSNFKKPEDISPVLNLFHPSKIKFGYCSSMNKAASPIVKLSIENVISKLKESVSIEEVEIPDSKESLLAAIVLFMQRLKSVHKFDINETIRQAHDVIIEISNKYLETVSDLKVTNSKRQRAKMTKMIDVIFDKVDVVICPTTCITAPKINGNDNQFGVLDNKLLDDCIKFCALASLTGIPAVNISIGYDEKGLPIGIQIMARWWREDLLLSAAQFIEHLYPLTKKPAVHHLPF